MPRTAAGEPWEQAIRSSVRSKDGFTVSNSRGRPLLRYRPSDGKPESCVLPVDWSKAETERILLLVNRIAKLRLSGDQGTLKSALQATQDQSTTMRRETDWRSIRDDFRNRLMKGGNQIKEKTWRHNYSTYIEEAISLIEAGKATDGYSLLRETLQRWEGKAESRNVLCGNLRNFIDHGIALHGVAKSWAITLTDIKELRGKRPSKREKAILSDVEILALIESLEKRNQQWANVIRLMALYGLRPVELQHLVPKTRPDGTLGMWCSYEKVCGATATKQRWIEPLPLKDAFGEVVQWNLAGALQAGLLDLPKRVDGEPRRLEGRAVLGYFRTMPEWRSLVQRCEERGEWARPYIFRDSYSHRAHLHKIEVGAIADSMGHSVAVHSSSYRWASNESTAAAFAGVFAD